MHFCSDYWCPQVLFHHLVFLLSFFFIAPRLVVCVTQAGKLAVRTGSSSARSREQVARDPDSQRTADGVVVSPLCEDWRLEESLP